MLSNYLNKSKGIFCPNTKNAELTSVKNKYQRFSKKNPNKFDKPDEG